MNPVDPVKLDMINRLHFKGVSRPIFKPSDSILLILNKNSVHITISNISQRFKKFMSYFLWWSIAVGGTLTLTDFDYMKPEKNSLTCNFKNIVLFFTIC